MVESIGSQKIFVGYKKYEQSSGYWWVTVTVNIAMVELSSSESFPTSPTYKKS